MSDAPELVPSRARRIREHLGHEVAERVIPTASMWPWIRPGDAIRFRRTNRAPRAGEIWVARRGPIHLAHRVLWTRADGAAFLKGDNGLRPDGWIPAADLFGAVEAIRRGSTWRPGNRWRDRALGLVTCSLGAAAHGARAFAGHLRRRILRRASNWARAR